jgi:hypothetical protein
MKALTHGASHGLFFFQLNSISPESALPLFRDHKDKDHGRYLCQRNKLRFMSGTLQSRY